MPPLLLTLLAALGALIQRTPPAISRRRPQKECTQKRTAREWGLCTTHVLVAPRNRMLSPNTRHTLAVAATDVPSPVPTIRKMPHRVRPR